LELVWTDRALRDLQAIDAYISADNPGAAARWIGRLLAAGERAARAPLAGRVVPEKGRAEVREVLVRTYRVVYRVCAARIDVLTVFEGHRLFPSDVSPEDD
jgi:addiction module RelE/StbE family toxin